MRICRYIFAGVLLRCGIALVLLVLIYVAIDFVETGDTKEAASYLLRLPMAISHMVPIALVIGVQASLAGWRARGEWSAFLAAGIAPWMLGAAMLLLPALLIPVQYVIQSSIVPQNLLAWQNVGGAQKQPGGPDRAVGHAFEDGGVGRWCKKGRLFMGIASAPGRRMIVERQKSGAPLAWRESGSAKEDSSPVEWRRHRGWQSGAGIDDGAFSEPCTASVFSFSSLNSGGLPCPSLTSEELRNRISRARDEGRRPNPFETELALRLALALSCLVLPFLALGMTIGGHESGHGRIIGAGLAAVFVFWLMLSVAWNGALAELWSPSWVSLGVPFLTLAFGGIFAAIGMRGIIRR